MLVKDCMTRHPIMIFPDTPVSEAQKIMIENQIRHLPVVGDGKRLLGLITRETLAFKPDLLGSLNVWEITRYLSNLNAKDAMVRARDVITITPDRTVERAARILTEHKIGALPVVEEDQVVVGMLSEVDLLDALQTMLGLPAAGVRATIRMPNRKGEFARMIRALADNNLGLMGVGVYPTRKDDDFYDAVLKIPNATPEQISEIFDHVMDQVLIDIREIV